MARAGFFSAKASLADRLWRDGDWPPFATVAIIAVSACAWFAMVSGLPGHNSPIASSIYDKFDLLLAKAAQNICGKPPEFGAPILAHAQWLTGWAIMVLAMMLPTSIPFLRTVSEVSEGHRFKLISIAAFAFIGTWTAAGFILIGVSMLLSFVAPVGTMAQPAIVAGIAAIAAGAYQFTPLKKACLDACRSPRAVLLCHWNGERPAVSAAEAGLRYAAICIGCCWATMILTLIVGAFALPLMIIISVIMLAERMLPWVRPLIPVQAGLAVALGLLLISGRLPAMSSLSMN